VQHSLKEFSYLLESSFALSWRTIISKTHQMRLAPTLRFDLLLKPQIENKVKIKVAQQG
jgi:hypothetical protein